jgi:glycosyltransferase involved in cell wall biosynthesis
MTIYQHIVEYNSNDGIGNDIKGLSELFFRSNVNNKIITIKNNFSGNNDNIIELDSKKYYYNNQDIHILHYGSAGYPLNNFLDLPGKKILRFHNLTPLNFFKNFCDDNIYTIFEDSYKLSIIELKSIVLDINEIWYDSEFNQKTLHSFFSFNNSNLIEKIYPIFRNYTKFLRNDFEVNYNLLSTGRIVPHKKIEDIIFTLFFLKKISDKYQLFIVGKLGKEFLKYFQYLNKIISELNLENNIQWKLDTHEDDLITLRNNTAFYISMSEHEGFGIPLLEAYAQGIPVIAYDSTAVGETLRSGGVRIHEKKFEYIAEVIHSINLNPSLKNKIRKKQYSELEYYENNYHQSDLI